MRMSVFRWMGGFALGISILFGGYRAFFIKAEQKLMFAPYEKAYYADPAVVGFVRPGLLITIVSAKIAPDGTISVDYKLSDPQGVPLDRSGVATPGPISLSF